MGNNFENGIGVKVNVNSIGQTGNIFKEKFCISGEADFESESKKIKTNNEKLEELIEKLVNQDSKIINKVLAYIINETSDNKLKADVVGLSEKYFKNVELEEKVNNLNDLVKILLGEIDRYQVWEKNGRRLEKDKGNLKFNAFGNGCLKILVKYMARDQYLKGKPFDQEDIDKIAYYFYMAGKIFSHPGLDFREQYILEYVRRRMTNGLSVKRVDLSSKTVEQIFKGISSTVILDDIQNMKLDESDCQKCRDKFDDDWKNIRRMNVVCNWKERFNYWMKICMEENEEKVI